MKQLPQKNILVVDDDPAMRDTLQSALSSYMSLDVIVASDGHEAVETLQNEDVDLVVTDIQMPRMDGLALVSMISQYFPEIPTIIITAHGSADMEEKLNRLGIVSYIKKPIDIPKLSNRIFDMLVGVENGYIQGISIASFLQLLQSDRKSCTLKVTSGSQIAYLHLIEGHLVDASCGEVQGVDAVYALFCWEETVAIDIQDIVRLKERTIDMDLTFLIMESIRRRDESYIVAPNFPESDDESFSLPERGSLQPISPFEDEEDCRKCRRKNEHDLQELSPDLRATLHRHLEGFHDVIGYKGSAIISPDGIPLLVDAPNPKDDLELVASICNEMMCNLQSQGSIIGMSPWTETVFRAPEGIVLFQCASGDNTPHFHLMTITNDPKGEGLLRVRQKRVLKSITAMLNT